MTILTNICFGLGRKGISQWLSPTDEPESIATNHVALDSGNPYLGTTEAYGPLTNEVFIGNVGDRQFDHVVVTAADTPTGSLRDLPDASIHQAIQNKLVLSYMVLREIAALKSVTLTSGYLSAKPGKASALQSALNSGVESLSRAAAVELAPVRINCISPGTVDSPMWHRLPEDRRREVLDAAAHRSLLGRVAQTDDIARAIEFAIECTYMTGETLFVDGGARFA